MADELTLADRQPSDLAERTAQLREDADRVNRIEMQRTIDKLVEQTRNLRRLTCSLTQKVLRQDGVIEDLRRKVEQ